MDIRFKAILETSKVFFKEGTKGVEKLEKIFNSALEKEKFLDSGEQLDNLQDKVDLKPESIKENPQEFKEQLDSVYNIVIETADAIIEGLKNLDNEEISKMAEGIEELIDVLKQIKEIVNEVIDKIGNEVVDVSNIDLDKIDVFIKELSKHLLSNDVSELDEDDLMEESGE